MKGRGKKLRCPNCLSFAIQYYAEEHRVIRKCHSCGHRWVLGGFATMPVIQQQ